MMLVMHANLSSQVAQTCQALNYITNIIQGSLTGLGNLTGPAWDRLACITSIIQGSLAGLGDLTGQVGLNHQHHLGLPGRNVGDVPQPVLSSLLMLVMQANLSSQVAQACQATLDDAGPTSPMLMMHANVSSQVAQTCQAALNDAADARQPVQSSCPG